MGLISLHRIGSFRVDVWGPSELPKIAIRAVSSHSVPPHLRSGRAEIPPPSGSFQVRLRVPSELPKIGIKVVISSKRPRKAPERRQGGGAAPVTRWYYWGWEEPAPDWIRSLILRASKCPKVLENALNPGPEVNAAAGTWNCRTHLGCARWDPPGPPEVSRRWLRRSGPGGSGARGFRDSARSGANQISFVWGFLKKEEIERRERGRGAGARRGSVGPGAGNRGRGR